MTGIPGMKKHRTLFPTIIMTLAALVLAPAVLAQPGPGGSDGRLRGGGPRAIVAGLRALDVSETQREQIREVAEQHQEAGAALFDRLRAARAALNDAVTAGVVNESTIRARAADVAMLEADAAVQRAHAHAQIWQILTPDQQAELREIRASAQDRLDEHRARRPRRR